MEFIAWTALLGVFLAGGLSPDPPMMVILTVSSRDEYGTSMSGATGVCPANSFWILWPVTGTAALASPFLVTFFVVEF